MSRPLTLTELDKLKTLVDFIIRNEFNIKDGLAFTILTAAYDKEKQIAQYTGNTYGEDLVLLVGSLNKALNSGKTFKPLSDN